MKTGIKWDGATKAETMLIISIARRARAELSASVMETYMDITACHLNGCKLDLDRLLKANGGDFAHDVTGIRVHIDRETGKLGDCFSPRYTAR